MPQPALRKLRTSKDTKRAAENTSAFSEGSVGVSRLRRSNSNRWNALAMRPWVHPERCMHETVAGTIAFGMSDNHACLKIFESYVS